MVNNGIWSEEEHDRFLVAIKQYPHGPWAAIADAVGTRSVRQVQTHTQKYYEKIMRRMRGVRKERKTWARLEHRIEDDILEFCKIMHGSRAAAAATGSSTSSSRSTSPTSSKPTSPSYTKMQSGGADVMLSDDVTIKLEEIDNTTVSVCRIRMSDRYVESIVIMHSVGGSEFGKTDSSSFEYSSDSQESQDSLEDHLSWTKLGTDTTATTPDDSEWLSFDDSLDYLIAYLAE